MTGRTPAKRILEGARQALAFARGETAEGFVMHGPQPEAISRDFRETIVRRAQRDPAFRAALIEEARQAEQDGDHDTAANMLSLVAQSMGLE